MKIGDIVIPWNLASFDQPPGFGVVIDFYATGTGAPYFQVAWPGTGMSPTWFDELELKLISES